jgi:hypothetical protein
MAEMTVRLTGEITGARNGAPWPPAGTEIELPEEEALGLINSGMARASDVAPDEVQARRLAAAEATLDDATRAQVTHATSTRERSTRSKRAHEPVNLGAAAEEQPDETDNGPRLPEVNAEDAARVENPLEETATPDGPTGATKPVKLGPGDEPETPKVKGAKAAPTAPKSPAGDAK